MLIRSGLSLRRTPEFSVRVIDFRASCVRVSTIDKGEDACIPLGRETWRERLRRRGSETGLSRFIAVSPFRLHHVAEIHSIRRANPGSITTVTIAPVHLSCTPWPSWVVAFRALVVRLSVELERKDTALANVYSGHSLATRSRHRC